MTQAQYMSDNTKNMLIRCRDWAKEIKLREDGLRELRTRTISSPNLDGMPRGGGDADANARRMIGIEKRESELKQERRGLNALKNKAKKALEGLKPSQRIFYQEYYIECHKCAAARVLAGISERTAMRYIQMIQGKKETGG